MDESGALLPRPDFGDYLGHQRDPQEMIDEMVRVVPAGEHPYRTTYPPSLREQLRQFETQVWDATS
ncbi:hypothetical protein O7607_27890 [Micromonospora sp. WMMA1949]|uniref:hypothetical protein n=1 Tax=Micromonospora sp. WMMA1949 TaxID=3015162 RepID=UPI0022B70895|nr:hypothetical protein [Micromonospora sp. WMMA1949]MCZ7429588.1 hypothetical protein [Micromonospora sp. WMMA1949]